MTLRRRRSANVLPAISKSTTRRVKPPPGHPSSRLLILGLRQPYTFGANYGSFVQPILNQYFVIHPKARVQAIQAGVPRGLASPGTHATAVSPGVVGFEVSPRVHQ
jgi:hypothetical protein